MKFYKAISSNYKAISSNYKMKGIIRSLHGLKQLKTPTTEVIITSNSGLFFTLETLRAHPKKEHPDVNIIRAPFWLDEVVREHDIKDWGQTPLGLPWYVRNEFQKAFPKHDNNKPITWGQFKKLRENVLESLSKKSNVKLYSGIPSITKKENQEYQITTKEGSFSVPFNTHFYNKFRELRVDHDLGESLPSLSHTNLYFCPEEKVPLNILLIGNGRSTIWLAKHFPKTIFSCIKNKDQNFPLLEGEELPGNIVPIHKEDIKEKHLELIPSPSNPKAVNIYSGTEKIFQGEFYCAIGLKLRDDLTKVVDKKNLTLYPLDTFTTNDWEWIAPEETPTGSLLESTLRWAYITDNLTWAYEPCSYHEKSIDNFINKMKENNINLSCGFFENLRKYIKKSRSSLSSDKIVELYKSCYRQTYMNSTEDDLEKIGSVLNSLEKDRSNNYVIK